MSSVEPGTAPAAPEVAGFLNRMTELLEQGDIESARAWIAEMAQRRPDAEQVQHYARHLAGPKAVVRPGGRRRSWERERAWLGAHAREFRGCWIAVSGDELVGCRPRLPGRPRPHP